MSERLVRARKAAGYEQAADAAEAFGWQYSTYVGHENGSRGFKRSVDTYARAFNVSIDWLMTGRGEMRSSAMTEEEREIAFLLRQLSSDRRKAAKAMLRGLAEDQQGLATDGDPLKTKAAG